MTVPSVPITQLPAAPSVAPEDLLPIVHSGQTMKATIQQALGASGTAPSTAPYVLASPDAGLSSYRVLNAISGLSVTDGGATNNITIAPIANLLALHGLSGTGIVTRTGPSTFTERSVVSGSTGIGVTDGDGVGGDITIAAAGSLQSLQDLAGTGFVYATAPGVYSLFAGVPGTGTVIGPGTSTINGVARWADTSGTILADGPTLPASFTAPSALVANATGAVTGAVGTTANRVLRTNGSSISFSQVALATDVSGTLPVANGGTGVTTFGGTNRLLYTTATDTLSSIATANTSALVTSSGGAPSWTSGGVANRVLRTDGSAITFSQVALTTDVTGTLPVANGGTGITAFGTGVAAALGQNVTGSGGIVLQTSASLTTPTINTAASVGGTWTAAATWTLPSLTLGGTTTLPGSGSISSSGSLTIGAGQSITAPTITASTQFIGATINTNAVSSLSLQTDSTTQFRIAHAAGATNYIEATGSNGGEPSLSVRGASTNAGMRLYTKGTGPFWLQTNGGDPQFSVSHTANAVNYAVITGNVTTGAPWYRVNGSDTNIDWAASSKGTGALRFFTNTTSNEQFQIGHTASANRYVTVTGSNGANPAISVSAGELAIGTNAWTLGTANVVSPTSPNRTLTVTIGGTTYYIAAKTTND